MLPRTDDNDVDEEEEDCHCYDYDYHAVLHLLPTMRQNSGTNGRPISANRDHFIPSDAR
jgi:hypothetical protein